MGQSEGRGARRGARARVEGSERSRIPTKIPTKMEGLISTDKKTVLPLKNISVLVKVKGYLVGVSSTLNYCNDTSDPLEVTFRFPLEQSFAVVGLEAVIDGRKVKAAVHEKEKARDMSLEDDLQHMLKRRLETSLA